jgi:O-antigen ligase
VPVATTAVDVGTPTDPSSEGSEVLLSGIPLVPPREDLWHAAVQMLSERPLLGVGPGTYPLRYGAYLGLPKWDERAYSHNIYLELGATTGIVGLAAFLVVVGASFAPLTRALIARAGAVTPLAGLSRRSWLAFAAILAAAVAFLGHGLFDYFFAFNPTNGLWWATLGLCVAAGRWTMSARAD